MLVHAHRNVFGWNLSWWRFWWNDSKHHMTNKSGRGYKKFVPWNEVGVCILRYHVFGNVMGWPPSGLNIFPIMGWVMSNFSSNATHDSSDKSIRLGVCWLGLSDFYGAQIVPMSLFFQPYLKMSWSLQFSPFSTKITWGVLPASHCDVQYHIPDALPIV